MKRSYCIALIATLAITIVFQAITNHRLYIALRDAQREVQALHRPFPALKGTNGFGMQVSYDFGRERKPALLLGFYPACPACQENWRLWKELAAASSAMGVHVYYVNVTPDAVSLDYCSRHQLPPEDVLNSVSPVDILMYRLDRTPITEIIDRKGQLLYQVSGLLDGVAMERLKTYLTVASL